MASCESKGAEGSQEAAKNTVDSKTLDSETYVLVDIGANLTNKKFSRDLDSVISRAREAGTTHIS